MQKAFLTTLALIFLSTGTALAELQPRGRYMMYDTDLNITWLTEVDMAGTMTWAEANAWARDLEFGGYDDWRLPRANVPDENCRTDRNFETPDSTGYFCTNSEMAHLFYREFGVRNGSRVTTSTNVKSTWFSFERLFNSNSRGGRFWTGNRQFLSMTSQQAWHFSFYTGEQEIYPLTGQFRAMAVRNGDVSMREIE